jgi:hypothetical protein
MPLQCGLIFVLHRERIGRIPPHLGPGVELPDPVAVHIVEKHSDLLAEVRSPGREASIHLFLDDGLPDGDHPLPWHIGQGPNIADQVVKLHILVVEAHEAVSTNSFAENGLPVEVAAHYGGPLEGGAEGGIHSLLVVHHDLFELQLVTGLQFLLQRLSHTEIGDLLLVR